MPDAALLRARAGLHRRPRALRARPGAGRAATATQYRIHGAGELLTTRASPCSTAAMVERGAAMIHAATVAYQGHGDRPAGCRRHRQDQHRRQADAPRGLGLHGRRLGLPGRRRPRCSATPSRCSSSRTTGRSTRTCSRGPQAAGADARCRGRIGRLTTVVHPVVIRYPRLADVTRRWSPEHRMVHAGGRVPRARSRRRAAPLAAAVYVERFEGARSRLLERSTGVDGRPHARQLPHRDGQLLPAGRDRPRRAASVLPWREHFEDKATVLSKALDGRPCHLLQVPARLLGRPGVRRHRREYLERAAARRLARRARP